MGCEDPLEEEMATHSSIHAWRISWTEDPGELQSHGVAKSWTQLKRLSSSSSSKEDLITPRACAYVQIMPGDF